MLEEEIDIRNIFFELFTRIDAIKETFNFAFLILKQQWKSLFLAEHKKEDFSQPLNTFGISNDLFNASDIVLENKNLNLPFRTLFFI